MHKQTLTQTGSDPYGHKYTQSVLTPSQHPHIQRITHIHIITDTNTKIFTDLHKYTNAVTVLSFKVAKALSKNLSTFAARVIL